MDSDDDEPVHNVSDVLSDDAIEVDEFGRMGPTLAPRASFLSRTAQDAQGGVVDDSSHDSTPDATPDTTLNMSMEDTDDEADRKPTLTARPSFATIPRKPSYSSDVPTVKAHMRGSSTSAVASPRPVAASHHRGSSTSATILAHSGTASALPSHSPPGHSRTSSSSGSGSGCSGSQSRTSRTSRSSGAASPFGPSPIVTARRPPPISVPGDGVILPPPRSASLTAPTSAKLVDALDAMPATAIPWVLDPDGTEELVTVRPSLEFDKGAETETLETVDTPDEDGDDFGSVEGNMGASQMPRSHTQETVMPRSATQETVTPGPGMSSAPSQRFFDLEDEGWEGEEEVEVKVAVKAKVKAEVTKVNKPKGEGMAKVSDEETEGDGAERKRNGDAEEEPRQRV